MDFNNPFKYFSIILAVMIVGAVSYQIGQRSSEDSAKEDTELSPIEAVYNRLTPTAKALYFKQSKKLTQPVHARLVELDEKKIGCFGATQVLAMSSTDTNLGGQCCGHVKNFEAYDLQLKALHEFIQDNGSSDIIPPDPYDTPVPLAQELTRYDQEIVLSSEEQLLFDDAVAMSHHGGPCCCKCWKWYVMSGLAKKLIVDEGWNALQISQLWDLSSSCGHAEDTNMFKHYDDELKMEH